MNYLHIFPCDFPTFNFSKLCVKFISNGESEGSKISTLCSSDAEPGMAVEIGII